MQTILLFIVSFLGAYVFFLQFSHPGKRKHRIPHIHIWNIEILPNLRMHLGSKTYHFHHWAVLGIFAISAYFLHEQVMQYTFVKGATLGGILQGLRYSDRFMFRSVREQH